MNLSKFNLLNNKFNSTNIIPIYCNNADLWLMKIDVEIIMYRAIMSSFYYILFAKIHKR